MTPIAICFINQKGGCGKSSCCFHLAGCFAELGHRVLLVDCDPQGSLSQAFFGSELVEHLEAQETTAAVFHDEAFVHPSSLILNTANENIRIIGANHQLAQHNVPCPESTGLRQYRIQSLVSEVGAFDLVLIDCPPNLYTCSWNALLAADFVLIPVPPEDFGTQGLRAVHQAVKGAATLNSRLQLMGHVVARYDSRLVIHRAYEQQLRRLYGGSVLETVIPEASAFKVALACRQPVTEYAPRSKAARLTTSLAHEIVDRIHRRRNQRQVA